MIRALLALALCGAAHRASAQTQPLPPDAQLLLRSDANVAALVDSEAEQIRGPRARIFALRRDMDGTITVDVFIRAERGVEGALRAGGARVGTRAGEWVTARIPLERLSDLARLPGVRSVEVARRATLATDSSIVDVGVAPLRRRTFRDQFAGATGRGAIVGIVDTGIDFTHPDFREDDVDRSRVLYVWDQTAFGSGPGTVGGATFAYGMECDRDALADRSSCGSRDYDGHGTHVAGIAAGDGSGTRRVADAYAYAGMAPGAELIVVKTDLSFASIIDGVDYIFRRAQQLGRPAVVNLSLGAQFGPHDGTEAPSLALDALSGPGRIVVVAAGNGGSNGNGAPGVTWPTTHAEGRAEPGDSVVIELTVPAYTARSGSGNDLLLVQAYYGSEDSFTVSVQRPNGSLVSLGGGPAVTTSSDTSGGVVLYNGSVRDSALLGPGLEFGSYSPTSSSKVAQLFAGEWLSGFAAPGAGLWRIVFRRLGGSGSGEVDAYVASSTLAAPVAFTAGATNRRLIGAPGTARTAITVGAYSTRHSWSSVDGNRYRVTELDSVETGDLLLISAPGPTRDGRIKPEITAPGRTFAALSRDSRVPRPLIATDSMHVLIQGTSMAAPHITGAIALLLGERPTLTPAEALDALRDGARADAYTSTSRAYGDAARLPNNSWGYGKLDAAAALDRVAPLAGRGTVADNPRQRDARSSERGTLLPLQSLRVAASDAEPLSVTQIGALVDGRDTGFRLAAMLDVDRDGEAGEADVLVAFSDMVTLDGPRYLRVLIPPGAVPVEGGGSTDVLLVGQLSGATPNATLFTATLLPDSSHTLGTRSGVTRTLGALSVHVGATRTTLLASGERVSLSQNPVRTGPLVINFADEARRADIYDFAGRIVWSISPAAGERSVRWDLRTSSGDAVAAGAYVVVLDTRSGVVRRKIFVLR